MLNNFTGTEAREISIRNELTAIRNERAALNQVRAALIQERTSFETRLHSLHADRQILVNQRQALQDERQRAINITIEKVFLEGIWYNAPSRLAIKCNFVNRTELFI